MSLREQLVENRSQPTLDSYRRLAEVFHDVLSEHNLDALLERIADTLKDLIPYYALTIYRADDAEEQLAAVLVRDQWADEILGTKMAFGVGLAGWAAENREPLLTNAAHLDSRAVQVPGTPNEQEAIICVPLQTKASIKGVLNIYRVGEDAAFTEEEFELAQSFGDAAALALDNAESRAALEQRAHTDSLTGLYNHRFFQERLRAELSRANRVGDSVALVMFDIDDFKKINDIFGHAVGDQILVSISEMIRDTIRGSDIACRIGGEEIALILPSCNAGDAFGFAHRLMDRLSHTTFDPVGGITISVGVAQGPEHAMNPRELLVCAEAAMMTVKARGKNGVLLYDHGQSERPDTVEDARDAVRSIAHMKMLQNLSGKLNRLNEVSHIASTISNELRTLIDYHGCRIYQVEGDLLVPVAVRGHIQARDGRAPTIPTAQVGTGIVGMAAKTGLSLLIPDALECEYAVKIPGSEEVEESVVAVPMMYVSRVVGVIAISKLGVSQFDEDDVRLLEVLSGHASVAFENARLYEAQRKEAESAKALLECADVMAKARTLHAIADETASAAEILLEAGHASLWLRHEATGDFRCAAHQGYVGDPATESVIRDEIDGALGARLLRGRKLPFVLPAKDVAEYFSFVDEAAATTSAVAPLHGIAGWIIVGQPSRDVPHFTEQRLRLLAGISYQTSVAMQKADFYSKQKENAEIANALLDFGRDLAGAEGPEETARKIVEGASSMLGSPSTVLWLRDPNTGELRAADAWGHEDAERERIMSLRLPPEVATPFVKMTRPFVVPAEALAGVEEAMGLVSSSAYAIAPMKLEGTRRGFIASAAPAMGDYEFSERKIRLLEGIAHQAVLAINSGAGFESLERTFIDTVEALANALEARDEYTSSHARWITDTSIEVGKTLGLDVQALKRLELGALFHDIGKIGISNDILQKPGPLTEDEWVTMRKHPEIGERILRPIERLAEVRPIVRACHEHYDGSGYPDGLAGEEIPIESRIILVVDAYHAITTDRPYRTGLSPEEAYRRLREASGTQFDPRAVDALLWLFEDRPELKQTK